MLDQTRAVEPSYYDVPILKKPVWKWQIASYFFFGGLSAGAYMLGRIAGRMGGKQHRRVEHVASYVALAALVPCPPLLIDDLGDPSRFHHMLRVWKPTSPMNLGTWIMVAYSGMAGFEVIRRHFSGRNGALVHFANNRAVRAVHDIAGVPLSLMMAGYTGVLLSCTSNPLWSKNPWLGPLFTASAISTGAAALGLALDCTNGDKAGESRSHQVLHHIDTAAHAAELVCLDRFNRFASEKGKPFRNGGASKYYAVAVGGVIAAEVLKYAPLPGKYRKPARIVASVFGLAAGFSLRWAMVFGGHDAASDPHLSRLATR